MGILDRADAWDRILEPRFAPMLEELAGCVGNVAPAMIGRLRREHPVDDVAVAIELVTARRRAAKKFADPERLLCDVEGVAQASGAAVAAIKARRFGAAERIEDLCSGIGGDTMALAATGRPVRAVDAAPARAGMTRHNAGVEVEIADIRGRPVAGAMVHVDPARRRGGARVWRYADCVPGPDVIEPLLTTAAGAALKLGPGVDWADIVGAGERECEVIGDRTGLLQTVVWCGALAHAPGHRTATRIDPDGRGESFTGVADASIGVADGARRYLVLPAAALERAQLVGSRIAGRPVYEIAAGLGWLTTDVVLDDPWFGQHEILCRMPWRPRRIRQWLADHDGGEVVVRTRARAVDTDRMQCDLRGSGAIRYTVFGVREGKQIVCYITTGVMT